MIGTESLQTPKPGDRISEYVLDERIGKGGFGEVWRARHHAFAERVVAIKIPGSAERAALLKREGALQDRVRHPNAVEILGMDADHEPPYLVLEYVDGESLRARLARERRLPPAAAVEIAVQVLGALEHAHARGVVHRDLKPENILLARKDGRAKLTDFGLGRLLEDERAKLATSASLVSQDGRDVSGTIAYMAPEQREPGRAVDARSDLYAFGIVLFEMLTGARPEGGEAPGDLVAGLDPRLDAVFRKCYARAEKRYATAAAVVADLAPLAPAKSVAAASGPLAPRTASLERIDEMGRPISPPEVIPLGRDGAEVAGGAEIRCEADGWVLVASEGAAVTSLLPSHVPEGKNAADFAERAGTAPLKLAEGVVIVAFPPAIYRFHDGEPVDGRGPLTPSGRLRRARREPPSVLLLVALLIGGAALLVPNLTRVVAADIHALWNARVLAAVVIAAAAISLYRRRTERPAARPMPEVSGAAPETDPALEPLGDTPSGALAGEDARIAGRPAGLMIRSVALMADVAIFAYLSRFVGGAFLAFLAYDLIMTWLAGATVGKWILGLHVVREDRRPVSFGRALGRTLAKVLSVLPFGLGFALAGVTPWKQSLHDFFSGTRVVRLTRPD